MKRIVIIFYVLLLGGVLIAQKQEKSFSKNEVKFNIPYAIWGAFPELSYERILQENLSLGVSLGISVEDKEKEYEWMKFQFTPYARWFWSGSSSSERKFASRFFLEANASVFCRSENEAYIGADIYDDYWSGGVGLGVGWKWIMGNNWVSEVLLGMGKDFSNSKLYPRLGFSIGKRFGGENVKENAALLLKKNELKLNAPLLIFSKFTEISYERIIRNDFSVGASVGFSIESETSYDNIDFMFAPYARWFWGNNTKSVNKYASGFFLEANASILLEKKDVYYTFDGNGKRYKHGEDYTGVGIGVAIGWKTITKNNWVGEVFLGLGKEFSTETDGYPRVGISIGKRF